MRQIESATPQFISVKGFGEVGEASWQRVALEGRQKGLAALPQEAREYVGKVEELVGVPVASVSVGPERESIIWVNGT